MSSIEVTPEAAEVLSRSLRLAGIDASAGGIRLRGSKALGGGFEVQVELAAEASEGEEIVESEGVRLFLDPAVAETFPEAVVTLEPQHEIVTVRPVDPA